MKTGLKIFGVAAAIIAVFLMALPTIMHKAGVHPDYVGPTYDLPGKRALIITTSHDVLAAVGETQGDATGVAASELTHPYYTFLAGGMSVDIASIKGGEVPIDPQSLRFAIISPLDERFLEDPIALAKAKNSIPIADVDINQYDAIMIAGGWGAAYDLAQSPVLATKVSEAYYGDKQPIIGSVCHGALGLVNAKDKDGNLLVAGRRMTGVTDKQVKELRIEITPKHPETELRKAGAIFEGKAGFRDFFETLVVIDDEERFITGQNQNSGLEASHLMMQLLAERN